MLTLGSMNLKLNSEQLVILIEIMDRNHHATLEQLCDLLKIATGVKVGKSTMGRITQKLNYSQKKDIISTMEENLEVPHKRV